MSPKSSLAPMALVSTLAVLASQASRAQDADDRAAVPPKIELQEASKNVRRVYKRQLSSRSPEDRAKAAADLISEASKRSVRDADRYVLLVEARSIAARAGDVSVTIQAVDDLSKRFRVDRLALLEEAVSEIARPRTLTASLALFRAWEDLVRSSIDTEGYESASRLARAATKSMRKTRDKVLSARAKKLEEFAVALEAAAKDVEPFVARLLDKPDDADARREVATFVCLYERDWKAGLPQAAEDPSTPLGDVAAKDLASSKAVLDIVDVGTAWHELGKTLEDVPRVSCYMRAVHWLEPSLARLPGLTKDEVSKRLARIYKEEPSLRPVVGLDRFKVLTLKSAWDRSYKTRSLDAMSVSRSGDALSFKNTTGSSRSALVTETTKLNGDFEATFELYGGKEIGLVNSSGYQLRHEYPSGKGWQRVRLARAAGKIVCEVNGRAVKRQEGSRWQPTAPDDMSSNIFVSLASGQECRIRKFALSADLDAPEASSDLDALIDRLRRGGRGGDDDDDDDTRGPTGRGRNGRGR